jgi:hypothetical protein
VLVCRDVVKLVLSQLDSKGAVQRRHKKLHQRVYSNKVRNLAIYAELTTLKGPQLRTSGTRMVEFLL